MGPGGLWQSKVLNSALLPQRLRPDTRPEHQDPVSHMAFHSQTDCLCAIWVCHLEKFPQRPYEFFISFQSPELHTPEDPLRMCCLSPSTCRSSPFPNFKSTFLKKYCLYTSVFFFWFVCVDLDLFTYFTVVSLALEELNDFVKFKADHNLIESIKERCFN